MRRYSPTAVDPTPHRRGRAIACARSPGARRRSTWRRAWSTAPTDSGPPVVSRLADALADAGIEVEDIGLRQPTLDDVFLTLTGAPIDDDRQGVTDERHRFPPSAERRGNFIGDTWIVAKRGLLHIRRQPEALADVTIQPIMFVLLFAFVFGGAIKVEGGSYREFLMGGIFAQTIVFGAFGVAIALAYDRTNGAIDRFRSLPMARGSVLAGHAVASLLRALLPIILMSICGSRRGVADRLVVCRGGRRLRPDARVLVRDHLAGCPAGQPPATPEAVQGVGFVIDLPDHLHREHVRPGRAPCPACCARSPSGTR